MDIRKMDREARSYFDQLPASMKMQIVEAGLDITTKNQLEEFMNHSLEATEPSQQP